MLIIIENKTTKEPTCKVVFTPLSSADFNAVPKLILDVFVGTSFIFDIFLLCLIVKIPTIIGAK